MFIEVTRNDDNEKVLVNVHQITKVEKARSSDNADIHLTSEKFTTHAQETYDEVKALIEQATGKGIQMKPESYKRGDMFGQ